MSRTPEQEQAVATRAKRLCVDAGAGSGKTSVLVDRIVHLLETRAAALEQIVAITFTDKAAAEMKDRLRRAFRAKAPSDDPDEMSRWRDFERRVETARISTIHSFCSALLRENALYLGLDPDFTVLADAEGPLLREGTVTGIVHALLEEEDEAALRAAVELSPAGLIREVVRLLAQGQVLERIAGRQPLDDPDAFMEYALRTAAACREAELMALRRSPEVRRLAAQLESFAGQCSDPSEVREQARRGMLEALEAIGACEDAASIQEILEGLAAIDFKGAKKKCWASEEACEEVKKAQDEVRALAREYLPVQPDLGVERAAAQLACDVFAVCGKARAAYAAAKAARTCVDFDDLIGSALHMLRERENVRARTARGVKFLLIDEFQDTDSAQLEIARLLAEHSDGPDLFIVGDAKQSIYDFRGAEVEVFQEERARAHATISLDVNFRSVPETLEFVNDVFARSGALSAVETAYKPIRAHRPPAGECRVEFLIPEVGEDDLATDRRRAEADLIAARLREMCEGPAPVRIEAKGGGSPRTANYGDVAILLRAMSDVHIYESSLRDHGIPYQVVAGAGFYRRQEILDLRNLLAVLIDPWDEMSLLGFLRGPMGRLSDESLACLAADAGLVAAFHANSGVGLTGDSHQLFRLAGDSEVSTRSRITGDCPQLIATRSRITGDCPQLIAAARLEQARALISELRSCMEMPLEAFLRHVLDRTGLEALALSQYLGAQKALNLRKVANLAGDFARTRPADLTAFVRYLDDAESAIREGDAAMLPEGTGAATLMTIHKAKGLEFPIVVLPDLARERKGARGGRVVLHRECGLAAYVLDGRGVPAKPLLYAAVTRADDRKDEAEHARLLYVAMTRARDWLLLSGAPKARGCSWLGLLDGLYGVLRLDDGARVAGEGWEAIVRRRGAVSERGVRRECAREPLPDREILEAQVQSVKPRAGGRVVFSVSELLDALDPAASVCREGGTGGSSGIDPMMRGSVVHRLFECWDFSGPPPIDAVLERACALPRDRAILRPGLVEIAARFEESPMGRRLKSEPGALREQRFLLRLGDALVSGTIDVVLPDGTIVDYKTGGHHPELHARYEWQVRWYAAALRRLRGATAPSSVLAYVDIGKQMEIELRDDLIEEALANAARALDLVRGG